MKYSAKELLRKYTQAGVIKSSWDSAYKQVFDYCMPARDVMAKAQSANGSTSPEYQSNRENQYSSVGEQACCDFVNTMQEVLCPPMADWVRIEAGVAFSQDERGAVNDELNKLCAIANEYKNLSYFDLAFSEFCFDLFAGTACMLILPGNVTQPLIFKAIPIKDYCIEEGPNGEVFAVYRHYSLRRELIKVQWPELKGKKVDGDKESKENADKEVPLIECTYYDPDLLVYHYVVINEKTQEILLEKEYDTNPFVVLRWNKASGEPYGRGPGLTALNDIKTLNLVKEYSLRNFAFNLPPLLVQEDGMIDVDQFDFTPLAMNVVPNTQTSIIPLAISPNYDIENYKVQELTMDIKRNTYGSTLPNEGSRNLTATEILARKAELRRSLNSVFGRLLAEGIIPMVRRIFDILITSKVIKAPPESFAPKKINGIIFKVKINTPVAKQLKISDAEAIVQAITMVSQLDPSGAMLRSLLKLNKTGLRLMDLLGVPNDLINSEEEVRTEQERIATESAQGVQQAVQTDVDAETAKAVGKSQAKLIEKAGEDGSL